MLDLAVEYIKDLQEQYKVKQSDQLHVEETMIMQVCVLCLLN